MNIEVLDKVVTIKGFCVEACGHVEIITSVSLPSMRSIRTGNQIRERGSGLVLRPDSLVALGMTGEEISRALLR